MDSLPAHLQIADLARHIDSLRALARGLVGDEHLAEDIVQDASLAALEHPPRDAGALGAWLRRTVIRRASNALRARSRRGRHEEAAPTSKGTPGPEEIAFQVELQQRLLGEVQVLPETYREVIWLRYWERRSPVEIAEQLGVSRETVKTRLRRAHLRLREGMDARSGVDRKSWASALLVFSSADRAGAGGAAPGPAATLAWGSKSLRVAFLVGGVAILAGTWAVFLRNSAEGGRRQGWPSSVEEVATPSAVAVDRSVDPQAGSAQRRVAADEGHGSLAVEVRWPDRAPAAQIGLVLRPLDGPRDERRAVLRETDGSGRARFLELRPGPYQVSIFRGGRHTIHVAEKQEVILDLEVRPGVDVQGVVVDKDGVAVPGARVWMSRGGASWLGGREATRADARGRFALRHVNPRHAVLAIAPGYAPSAPHEVSAFQGFAPQGHDFESRCTLVLDQSGGAIQGRVRASDGRAVSGARVALHSPLWRAFGGELTAPPPTLVLTTDETGSFHGADLPHGEIDVSVLADNFPIWFGRVVVRDGEMETIDLDLFPGVDLQGSVRDGEGRPVGGATIQLSLDVALGGPKPAFELPTVESAADGAWRLELLPAVPLVACATMRGRRELGLAQRRIEADPGESLRWDAVLTLAGTLHGRVVDETGAPCPDLMVRAVTQMGGGPGGRTDERGAFFMGAFPEEPLRLEVHPAVGFGTLARIADVRAASTPVEIVVSRDRFPTAAVRARLVDAAGILPDDASIFVEAEELERRAGFARRVEDGWVDFADMVPGTYRLRVFTGERTLHIGDWFELGPAETRDLGELTTGALAELRVRVLGQGEPRPDVVRAALWNEEQRLLQYLDVNGSVLSIDRILPGAYELQVQARGFVELFESLRVEDEVDLRVELARGVEVELVLNDGGVPWKQLHLVVRDAAGNTHYRADFFSDDELTLRLRLPSGEHQFEVVTEAGLFASGPVTVPRASERPIELPCEWSNQPNPPTDRRHDR